MGEDYESDIKYCIARISVSGWKTVRVPADSTINPGILVRVEGLKFHDFL
jgi:hypothetical protein